MVANTYSNMLVHYTECNSKSWLGTLMAELIRDFDENTNQIRWKVINKNGNVIIITASEDVADSYYQEELRLEYSVPV